MKLQIKQEGIIHYVNTEEVVYCKADRAYCTIFFLNDEELICSKPLSEISKLLRQPYFVRIHDSFLVNLHFIKKQISSNCKLHVLMSNGEKLPVARRKKSIFQQAMNKFLSK